MLYAVVKKYESYNGGMFYPFEDWEFKPNEHYEIYEQMMYLTDGDHEISSDAASWCELASEGEIYEFREGEIEMMDID